MNNSSRKKWSTFDERVNWLVVNESLWYKFGENLIKADKNLIRLMKKDKLISPTTYWLDARMRREVVTARNLINLQNGTVSKGE